MPTCAALTDPETATRMAIARAVVARTNPRPAARDKAQMILPVVNVTLTTLAIILFCIWWATR